MFSPHKLYCLLYLSALPASHDNTCGWEGFCVVARQHYNSSLLPFCASLCASFPSSQSQSYWDFSFKFCCQIFSFSPARHSASALPELPFLRRVHSSFFLVSLVFSPSCPIKSFFCTSLLKLTAVFCSFCLQVSVIAILAHMWCFLLLWCNLPFGASDNAICASR